MSISLRSKTIVPKDGWYYIQPETKFRVDAESLDQLIERVIIHRRYKNIQPILLSDVAREIEEQICERLKYEPNFVIHE